MANWNANWAAWGWAAAPQWHLTHQWQQVLIAVPPSWSPQGPAPMAPSGSRGGCAPPSGAGGECAPQQRSGPPTLRARLPDRAGRRQAQAPPASAADQPPPSGSGGGCAPRQRSRRRAFSPDRAGRQQARARPANPADKPPGKFCFVSWPVTMSQYPPIGSAGSWQDMKRIAEEQ